MEKTVDIRFEATACFSVRLEIEYDQYEKLKKLCEKENPFLTEGDELHKLLLVDNNILSDDFDYINRDVDIEEIEFDDVPSVKQRPIKKVNELIELSDLGTINVNVYGDGRYKNNLIDEIRHIIEKYKESHLFIDGVEIDPHKKIKFKWD